MFDMLRIALVQMRCEKGALEENLETIRSHVDAAARRSIDVIAFPEMSYTGYADPQKFPHAAVRVDGAEVAELRAVTAPFDGTALVGIIEQNPAGKPLDSGGDAGGAHGG